MIEIVYAAVVCLSGGVLVGFLMGLRYAAARAEARVYQMPSPAEIVAELRGPLGGHASSGRPVRDLAPPPAGPAPGARPDPSLAERVPRGRGPA